MGSVRHGATVGSSRRPAELAPGEVVWASIVNGIENPAATGKARPVILIEPSGWAWRTMGLTTRPRHHDGAPRVAIPSARAVGLKQPGWLWSGKLCFTSGIDIQDHIGWIDLPLAFEVIKLAGLTGPTMRELLAAARDHHVASPGDDLSLIQGGVGMNGTNGSPSAVKLAPSDLTFLWSECERCFWLKTRGILKRPSAPFPKVFTMLDNQTKDFFFNKRSEEMAEGLRPGRVAFGDRWVRSRPLKVPGHETQVTLQGKIDTALSFDDGSYGIIDFKTSEPKAGHVEFYGRQLASYALAVENPTEGALDLTPVTQLGLLCVEPIAMIGIGDTVAYKGTTHFLEIERDDDAFMAFLNQVLFLLEKPEPPDSAPKCGYCAYLANGSLVLLTGSYGT